MDNEFKNINFIFISQLMLIHFFGIVFKNVVKINMCSVSFRITKSDDTVRRAK